MGNSRFKPCHSQTFQHESLDSSPTEVILMSSKKNCGCGQDPCKTYGAETFEATTGYGYDDPPERMTDEEAWLEIYEDYLEDEDSPMTLEEFKKDWIKSREEDYQMQVKFDEMVRNQPQETTEEYIKRIEEEGRAKEEKEVKQLMKQKGISYEEALQMVMDNAMEDYTHRHPYDAESFEAPYAGAGSLFGIGQNTGLEGFTTSELTTSSAIHGDFDEASLNYSGHQNLEVRAETVNTTKYFDEREELYGRQNFITFSNLGTMAYNSLYMAARELGATPYEAYQLCNSKWIRHNEDFIPQNMTEMFMNMLYRSNSHKNYMDGDGDYEIKDYSKNRLWKDMMFSAKTTIDVNKQLGYDAETFNAESHRDSKGRFTEKPVLTGSVIGGLALGLMYFMGRK